MEEQPSAVEIRSHGVRTAVVVAVTGSALARSDPRCRGEGAPRRPDLVLDVRRTAPSPNWRGPPRSAKWTTRRVLVTGIVINGGRGARVVPVADDRHSVHRRVARSARPSAVRTLPARCMRPQASQLRSSCSLVRWHGRTLPPLWSVSAGAAALLLAMPVIAAGHTHDAAGHVHVVAGADALARRCDARPQRRTHDGTSTI